MSEVDTANALLRLQQTLDAASKYLDEHRSWADQVKRNLGIQDSEPAPRVAGATQSGSDRVRAG